MITLIYGTDIVASRNYFLSEKEKLSAKATLDGASVTLTDIVQATIGSGLFGEAEAIYIEDLLSKKKSSKELDSIITHLSEQKNSSIFLWESKELTTKQLQPFKTQIIKNFSLPKTVFAFVDSLAPKSNRMLQLFHELLHDEDANFALAMLQRQVRLLLALSQDSLAKISEVTRLAPWQEAKLKKQSRLFTLEQLLDFHEKLYQLEKDQKTGNLSLPLDEALDFLLVSL